MPVDNRRITLSCLKLLGESVSSLKSAIFTAIVVLRQEDDVHGGCVSSLFHSIPIQALVKSHKSNASIEA
jgi:hypothetical protein